MSLEQCFQAHDTILMEGALGERLKREYGLILDEHVTMAPLVYTDAGREALSELWTGYAAIAAAHGLPFMAATPTRRCDRERVIRAGFDDTLLLDNVRLLREALAACGTESYAGGQLGCHGNAYTGEGALDTRQAADFHTWQVEAFGRAGVDFLYASIMPALPEARGMALALADSGLPYIMSFTIQQDGRLIDGTTIHDAITAIDGNVKQPPLCYMATCVHPRIVYEALSQPFNRTQTVQTRFKGLQANTSPLSYAELDGSADLKSSEPEDFARDMARLRRDKGLTILGGCCGTDNRHLEQTARLLAEVR